MTEVLALLFASEQLHSSYCTKVERALQCNSQKASKGNKCLFIDLNSLCITSAFLSPNQSPEQMIIPEIKKEIEEIFLKWFGLDFKGTGIFLKL